MKLVKTFFDKFNNSAIKEIKRRTDITEIIKTESGVVIPIENISFVAKSIKLKLSSIEKNQVFIKKQKIISSIKTKLPNLNIDDIY